MEKIFWQSRPAYKLRYPLLAGTCFLGSFVLLLGSFWVSIGVVSFFSSFVFLGISIWNAFSRERKMYYLTNIRLVSVQGELPIQELSDVKVEQSFLDSFRKVGDLMAETTTGSWLELKRVKDPDNVKEHILRVRDAARGQSEPSTWQPSSPTIPTQEQDLALLPSDSYKMSRGTKSKRR